MADLKRDGRLERVTRSGCAAEPFCAEIRTKRGRFCAKRWDAQPYGLTHFSSGWRCDWQAALPAFTNAPRSEVPMRLSSMMLRVTAAVMLTFALGACAANEDDSSSDESINAIASKPKDGGTPV